MRFFLQDKKSFWKNFWSEVEMPEVEQNNKSYLQKWKQYISARFFRKKRRRAISKKQFQELKDELLEEAKKQDDLRNEILKSLRIKRGWRDLLSHPAILLIIGFVLTSVIGAFLTAYWQNKDKEKQNTQLIKQNKLANKSEIMNETSRLVFQTYVAASDMIYLFQNGEMPEIREKILLERLEHWQKTSREWREKSPVLEKKMRNHFRNDEIFKFFNEIISLRVDIGTEIRYWRGEIKEKGWDIINDKCRGPGCGPPNCKNVLGEKYFASKVRCTNGRNDDMQKKALAVIEYMMEEIKADEADVPTEQVTLWERIGRWFM